MIEILVGSIVGLCVVLIVMHAITIHIFTRRQRELEELAFIEQKERREYLAHASKRMSLQEENMRRAQHGLDKDLEKDVDLMSVGNRRMREGGA